MKKIVLVFFVVLLTLLCHSQSHNSTKLNALSKKREMSFSLINLQELAQVSEALAQHEIATATEKLLHLSEKNLRSGRIDYAMNLVFEAQEIVRQNGSNQLLLGRCNQMLGNIFFTRYMESESIEFFHRALEFFISSKSMFEGAEVLRSMSEAYFSLGDTASSLYCIEALRLLATQVPDPHIEALENESLGDFMSSIGKFKESVFYYQKSLDGYLEVGNLEKISDMMLSIAISEESLGNHNAARLFIDSALVFNIKNRQFRNYYEAYYYKAEFTFADNPELALELALSALDSLDLLQLTIHKGIYLKLIVLLEQQLGNFENALVATNRFQATLNKIYGSDVERKIAGLQLEVETGKLNHRIDLLQKEQELATVNARSQRNMLFYFFLAIVVLFTMALNNMRRLQYRLYLLKEFALDFSWIQYFLAFLSSLFYFAILLIFINPFNLTQNASVYPWIHYSVIAFLMSALSVTGIFLLPARWSAKPGFNSRFTITALVFIVLMNAAIIFYSILAGISGNSVYDLLNVVLVLTGITIIPVFYFIIYLEKVLLRKHIQMAGMLSNRIQSFKPGKMEEIVTVYSDRSRDMLEVSVNNLLLVEANGNYSKIVFLENEKMKSTLILISLTKLLEQLAPFSCFSRCHKSYIVNLNKVKKVMGNSHGYKLDIPFVEEPIPVSRSYAADFIRDFNKVFKEGEHRN